MNTDIKIFVNYRRADSPCFAERIRDWFMIAYQRENVFMDFDAIPPFVDFEAFIISQIDKVDVMLVIIGPEWTRMLKERLRGDSVDYVRLEIREALQRGKLVAPILVDGATAPGADDLPVDIRAITRANMPRLDGGRQFLDNIERLIEALPIALSQHAQVQSVSRAEAERMVDPVELMNAFPPAPAPAPAPVGSAPPEAPRRSRERSEAMPTPEAEEAYFDLEEFPLEAMDEVDAVTRQVIPTPPTRVALCYTPDDLDVARRVEIGLTDAGFQVRVLSDTINVDAMGYLIGEADVMVMLISAHSKRYKTLHTQIDSAHNRETPILPVLVAGEMSDAPYALAMNQAVDLRDFEAGWPRLLDAVRDFIVS